MDVVALVGLSVVLGYVVHRSLAPPPCPACPRCPACPGCPACPAPVTAPVDRDRAVLEDPLYPPYNRPSRSRGLPDPAAVAAARGYTSADAFRLVAHLRNDSPGEVDAGGNVWKLFARATSPGSSRGEFFAASALAGVDLKVALPRDVADALRDVDALPDVVRVCHPLFASGTYTVAPLPSPPP